MFFFFSLFFRVVFESLSVKFIDFTELFMTYYLNQSSFHCYEYFIVKE